MDKQRVLPAVLFAVAVSALVGGVLGRRAQATSDPVTERYRTFTAALAAIEREYVEEVPSDRLVYSAINGMLQTLDPHSSFLDPRQYAQMRERQEGRYYGLGISIVSQDGDINVVSLFEGSPAYKRGIRRGDVIARIEGEDTKGWTNEQAVKALRGPKGSTVSLGLRRQGYDALIELTVERDEVNIPTIQGAFMVDDQTGYVRLRDFSETTDRDLGVALDDLREKGMRRLLLDLRDNPGGPLDQAIKVSDRFLPRGDMVVYTRGRTRNSDQDYRAQQEASLDELPVVILVNRNSASAAEIVSGALQDHDRAFIVGERTFGKALVQSIYRISEGAGLALTTARYYTPSGRLIQRPWDGAFDEYLTYSLREQDAERQRDPADLKFTDAGRKVYGGGGIEPDKHIAGPVEGFNPTRFGRALYARQVFADYAELYSAVGDTRVRAESHNRKVVARGFEVDDETLADFRVFLEGRSIRVDGDDFAKDRDFIRAMIQHDIDLALFGVEEARRNLLRHDPQATFALSQFDEAVRLTRLGQTPAVAARPGE